MPLNIMASKVNPHNYVVLVQKYLRHVITFSDLSQQIWRLFSRLSRAPLRVPSQVNTQLFAKHCFMFYCTVFEDKSFSEEEVPLAVRLFGETPPFLLSQILGLSMEEWLAIERGPGHKKEAEKQRGSVLLAWGRTRQDSAKWSVLVEALIILGLRGNAQIACIEKGKAHFQNW